jgi:ribosome-binding factor A
VTPTHKRRPERVAALVQETLAETLATHIKDPRVGFVTVTAVHVSADCGHAHVHVSPMGTEEEKERAMEGLASAKGFLRTQLARALPLRVAPEIHFVLDRGLEHAHRINAILDRLAEEHESE